MIESSFTDRLRRDGGSRILFGRQWLVVIVSTICSMTLWGCVTRSWWVAAAIAFFGVYGGLGGDKTTERWYVRLGQMITIGGTMAAINHYALGRP